MEAPIEKPTLTEGVMITKGGLGQAESRSRSQKVKKEINDRRR